MADCCMPKSWEWGFMVAVVQQQPPWSVDARNLSIKQKTSPPAPIPPSAPPLPPRIMPPWCSELVDAKKQPVQRGGHQDNGLEAGCHGQWVRICLLIYLTKTHVTNKTSTVDASWSKWPTAAAMVPHSRRQDRKQSTSMLADCLMQRRQEWGTTAAMGQGWLSWLVGAWFS